MIRSRLFQRVLLAIGVALLAGCATKPGYDYTAFRESRPKSILVLPPLNDSPDVNATYSMYAQTTLPLAESGYYVLPVAVVGETFKQNGLTNAADIHGVDAKKLNEIFGADAGLYITVKEYGTSYMLISSQTVVTATVNGIAHPGVRAQLAVSNTARADLAATQNTEIEITVEGPDEEAAIDALCKLIADKFGEE